MSARQAGNEIIEALVHSPVLGHNRVPLSREGFVFALFRSYALILEQIGVGARELLEKRRLLVVRLQHAVLVWPELLKLSFEQLRLLIRNGFLVENEDVGDVVRVNLLQSVHQILRASSRTNLVFEIL